ncbi:MAG: hypothetical protein IE937_11145, partial [Gammaproteobacteria bacterium]|nr:hypothetical protein [Gammaproteobacteria bacterium]
GYSTAVGFYQLATFNQHPQSSTLWLGAITLGFIGIALALRRAGKPYRMRAGLHS